MKEFATSCVTITQALVPALVTMVEEAKKITWEEFKEGCQPESLKMVLEGLGYTSDSRLKIWDDWSVRFYKSQIENYPCLFLDHSRIEYVFLEAEDICDLFS